MKTISAINWTLIAIYGLYLLFAVLHSLIFGINSDAAGRGMAKGFMLVGVIAVVVLIGLNLLPFGATKVITLILLLMPLFCMGQY